MKCEKCTRNWCKCNLINGVCPICDGRWQRGQLRAERQAEARAEAREPVLNHGVKVRVNGGPVTTWRSLKIDMSPAPEGFQNLKNASLSLSKKIK